MEIENKKNFNLLKVYNSKCCIKKIDLVNIKIYARETLMGILCNKPGVLALNYMKKQQNTFFTKKK